MSIEKDFCLESYGVLLDQCKEIGVKTFFCISYTFSFLEFKISTEIDIIFKQNVLKGWVHIKKIQSNRFLAQYAAIAKSNTKPSDNSVAC